MELSDYMLETLRQDGEFILYRGRQRRHGEAGPPTLLLVTPRAERPAPASLRRMEQEYSLRAELDPGWAAQPLALVSHQGRTMLVLADPGGEPLDRLLGSPLELTPFLRLAVSLSAALGRLHGRGLIHKDIKPANVLVDGASGQVWLMGFGIASRLPRERHVARPSRVHRRDPPLHGARTDRTHESVARFAQRPVCPRRHPVRDVDRQSPVHRFRSDGMGPLPHREAPGAARRAAEGGPRRRLGGRHEAARQDRRGPLSDGGRPGARPAALPCCVGGAAPDR